MRSNRTRGKGLSRGVAVWHARAMAKSSTTESFPESKNIDYEGVTYPVLFYDRDINVKVITSFYESYVCYRHGYMGGKDMIQYSKSYKPKNSTLDVSISDIYEPSLSSGTKMLIAQCVVVQDSEYVGVMCML